MSSVVVSGDSDNGVLSEGKEGNPIELDDSSTNTNNSDLESQGEEEIPMGPIIFKREKALKDHGGSDSGDNGGDNRDEGGNERGNGSESSRASGSGSSDYHSESDDDDDSGKEGDKENSEGDDDDDDDDDNEMKIDTGGIIDEKVEGSDGSYESLDGRKGKDGSPKTRGRVKNTKNLWGNIESMIEISKSPYEGNECAEVGEDCFEELRQLMDCSLNNGVINPGMIALVGDKLAGDLSNAHREIGKSGMLYSANWKEGKIRDSDFGWIPKRQLLLCLHEHRFAKGDVNVLQLVSKNLDCTKLVLEAMKLWDLMEAYPNLASNKGEETFAFGPQKIICYKCQIFVARAFATLQILKKTEGIQQSLTKKIKTCLAIMNQHVRTNQIELARIRKKAKKRKALQSTCEEEPDIPVPMDSRSPLSRRSPYSEKRRRASKSREPKPSDTPTTTEPKKRTYKRRRKIAKSEDREESIFMLFDTMQMQLQRLNQMMSFFQSQLHDHRYSLREEIREKLEKDGDVEV